MDYIGSKEKLNRWIFSIIEQNIFSGCFLDACAGSGAVSYYASQRGWDVVANDLMSFSSSIIYGSCGFDWNNLQKALFYIEKLNMLLPIEGFIYNNYSEKSTPSRLFFSVENAGKIDAIRQYIEQIGNINIKNYLLYCLIEATSRVLNTTGVQAAYLKKLKDRAQNPIIIKPEEFCYNKNLLCLNKDIKNLWDDKKYKFIEDIIYIDPPYNQRQYGPNYHLFETIIKYDNPEIKGVAGLRDWKENKSEFCNKKSFFDLLNIITNKTKAKFLYLSYNSEGIVSQNELKSFFGNVKIYEKEYKRYKSQKENVNNDKLFEFLFEVKL